MAAASGYGRLRHPRYAAFIVIMIGFLSQWPTVLTLVMFPILVYVYVRLARSEESALEACFGERYRSYAKRTPRFVPRLSTEVPAARSR